MDNLIISGSQATLAAGRDQRIWVAHSFNDASMETYSGIDTPQNASILGSHLDMVIKASANTVTRYLGMRGAG